MSDAGAAVTILTALIVSILLFCGVVIKRYMIDKKYPSYGAQVVGEEMLQNYSNREKKKAFQEIVYQKDAQKESQKVIGPACRLQP